MEKNVKKKKPFYKKWWFWALAIFIIIIAANMGGKGNNTSNNNKTVATTTTSNNKTSSVKKDSKKYSLDKFMKISMGSTYDDVKAILGDGTEESSSGDGDLKTVSYSWKNNDGSNISVMIQGNKVITKAQVMLQTMDAKVTMEKYNKINNGMTYDQIKAILGDGQLASQTELIGSKSEIYEWINTNGSNMNVTFVDGKADTKAQFSLK